MSRLPTVMRLCQSDINGVANAVNSAQRRLLYAKEAGDEGWWGTWAEIAFNVDRTQPVITLPRDIARLEAVNVCNHPVAVNNQFFEYLEFGNGRMPKRFTNCPGLIQFYSRNNAATFRDLSNPPQILKLVLTDSRDIGKRVLIQGFDSNSNTIYTQDGTNKLIGVYVPLDAPFVSCPTMLNTITGIQKDQTYGNVQFFQVHPDTGEEILLLTMEPGETTGWYRRYFLNPVPLNCCQGTGSGTTVQVTAIAKLEFIPVAFDTDYCLIQNLEALIEECQSLRLSEVDKAVAKQMAMDRHKAAIAMLNGELKHYVGVTKPAISVAPFGSARLEKKSIGTLI
jgi:hypothetical protein